RVCMAQRPNLYLYVDDIILTASFIAFLQSIIATLHAEFSMTDLGLLNYFLGISVTRNTSGMFLSQQKYASKLLERAGMLTCNPCRTPVDTDSKLSADGDLVSDPTLYPITSYIIKQDNMIINALTATPMDAAVAPMTTMERRPQANNNLSIDILPTNNAPRSFEALGGRWMLKLERKSSNGTIFRSSEARSKKSLEVAKLGNALRTLM
ncbi:ribonuclease H-like domain-containing protein, partial [Tanacetum coccineum]